MARTTSRAVPAGRRDDASGPRAVLVANELLVGLDAARLLSRGGQLVRRRRTPPRDVLVVPGWLAGDRSTAVLRAAIARDGHRVRGWGDGAHRGAIGDNVTALAARVRRLTEATGQPVDLVGWSLGGVVAREVGRRATGCVRRIVTMGTPLDGATGTLFEPWFDAPGRRRAPPAVPTTVLWSRRDGIVGWRAQLDDGNPWAEHVEVRSRHLGFGVDPVVIDVVRDRIAAAVGAGLRARDVVDGSPAPTS